MSEQILASDLRVATHWHESFQTLKERDYIESYAIRVEHLNPTSRDCLIYRLSGVGRCQPGLLDIRCHWIALEENGEPHCFCSLGIEVGTSSVLMPFVSR